MISAQRVQKLACTAACLLCVALLATPSSAGTLNTTEVGVVVDGEAFFAPIELDDKGVGIVEQFVHEKPGEWKVTLNALLDPDPEILYAASVIDFGAPSSFGFLFSQAIVPTTAPGIVSHTHSSSTTDGGGGAGTPVTALPPPAIIPTDGAPDEIAVYTLSTNGGASFLNAGMDLSPSFVGAAPSDTQGPFSEGPSAGPALAGAYNLMRVDLNFGMDGNGDIYTFNGRATVIPEPSTIALLLVAGLLLFVRRSHRAG